MKSPVKFFICVILSITSYFLGSYFGLDEEPKRMFSIVILMGSLWITEAINIYITALIPLVLFPVSGIMGMKEIAPRYMSHIIFLFVGGFLLAFALERWNIHKRLALNIIVNLGGSPSRILLSFMLSSFFLSMWILNTATTMMLLPAALAIISHIIKGEDKKFQTGLLLGIAFASSIGGSSTLVGTLPNLILSNFVKETKTIPHDINFANWMMVAFPVAITFLFVTFFFLKKRFIDRSTVRKVDLEECKTLLNDLGKMKWQEKAISTVFAITVLLWFFRNNLKIGSIEITGWVNLIGFHNPQFIQDGTIAIASAILLFLIPGSKEGGLLLWEDFKRLPIGIIFLFGSGFALSEGIIHSGLADIIKTNVDVLSTIPAWTLMLGLVIFMIFMTEFTSNSASATLFIPLTYIVVQSMDTPAIYFLIPLTLAASFAFMLPVATPPNTLVFGTEKIVMKDMVRTGIYLNLIGVVVIFGICNMLVEMIW